MIRAKACVCVHRATALQQTARTTKADLLAYNDKSAQNKKKSSDLWSDDGTVYTIRIRFFFLFVAYLERQCDTKAYEQKVSDNKKDAKTFENTQNVNNENRVQSQKFQFMVNKFLYVRIW